MALAPAPREACPHAEAMALGLPCERPGPPVHRWEIWDLPRLQRLVAVAVLHPPRAACGARALRLACGVFVSCSLWANIILTLFILGIYPTHYSIASCTDFCHSLCSLVSHAVLVYLLESGRLEALMLVPDLEDAQAATESSSLRCRRMVLRTPLLVYPLLGLTWWLAHFPQWMPGGSFWDRYGQVATVCAVVNTVTAWVWYSGPVCVVMLMLSILTVHEALLDLIMQRLEGKSLLPSCAAVLYDRVLRSLEAAGSELQFVVGFFLLLSMLAFATMVVSLLLGTDPSGFGPASVYSTEELRVVLQTLVLVGVTLATFSRGARFTAKAQQTELCANSRLLQRDISGALSEALAVQQMQRQRGGWLVWGVRVDNALMVKIISIYAAGAYYLVTVCLRYFNDQHMPQHLTV